MAQQAAMTAKDMSQTKLEGTDVLSRALGVPSA